ncbi:MAG: hypothetical protein IAF38_09630 [Bacteroidia bacterium]|nr:hypothetical protein [Bacteroidia bacterium]
MKKFPHFILIILLSFFSCKKDTNDAPETTAPTTGGNVSAKVLVQVTNTSGSALSGASVIIGSASATTDQNGLAYISASTFSAGRNLIKVSKSTYFKSYQLLEIANGSSYSVAVVLTPKTIAGSFSTAAGGTINATNGGSVVFSASSIVDMNGNVYSGTVNVTAVYIAPNATNASSVLPNSFLGYNASSQLKFAENHGALVVELEGTSGQALQIASGNTAQIHIPVAASDLSTAPSSIPLYYFDESSGYWKEDGSAALTGGTEFVGTVSHFTFWMCPYVYNHFQLSGSVVCGANGLDGVKVSVYNQWGSYLGSVTTGPGGVWSGMIPETLTFNLVVSDICGSQVYTTGVGPFSSATNLPAMDICTGSVNYGVITGTFTDCNNQTDHNSYCRVQSNGLTKFIAPLPSGYFNSAVLFCTGSTSAVITGVNMSNNQVSIDTTMNIAPTMNFGTKQVCTTASEFCTFVLAGTNAYYTENAFANFTGVLDLTQNKIYLTVVSGQFMNETHFSVTIPNTVAGTYSVGGSPFSYSFILSGNNGTVNLTVNLTNVGTAQGDAIEGTINNVTFVDQGGNSKTLANCSFRILIDTVQ